MTTRGAGAFNTHMSEPTTPVPPSAPRKPIDQFVEKTASEVRKQPVKSVVWAFFIGILLTVFPIGRIVGGVVSLAFGLLRPVLMLLGAVKLCEEFEERRK